MSHANAALTPRARLRLARLIVDDGWPIARAAERFPVSWFTANRWAGRYRVQGAAGMADRSCRPHRSPLHLRWKQRLGPVAIAARVGCSASTAHQVLRRCRINRRAQGKRHRAATAGKPRTAHYDPTMGTAFVHTVLDDHSRVAYAEIHDDDPPPPPPACCAGR